MDNIFSWGSDPTYTTKILDSLPISSEDSVDPRRMNMVETVMKYFTAHEENSSLNVLRNLTNKNVPDTLKYIYEYCLIHERYSKAMSVKEKKQYEKELERYEND